MTGAAPVLTAECGAEGRRVAYTGIECDGAQEAQPALIEQRRSGSGWTRPRVVEDESCADPTQPASALRQQQQIDLPAAAARAFQRMDIAPSGLEVQPPDGWTLVNLDTIAYADDAPRVRDTELFGIPVSIRAVPDSYTWTWGDGVTDSGVGPGAPYPHHTVTHAYRQPGTVTVTLTTTWRGQFRVVGGNGWTDLPGEATTSESSPLEVREATTRLVEDPLR